MLDEEAAGRAESQGKCLLKDVFGLGQIVFLDLRDLGAIDFGLGAVNADVDGIGLLNLHQERNAFLALPADPDLARLDALVIDDRRVVDALDVGFHALELLRGLIHVGQHGFQLRGRRKPGQQGDQQQ